MQCALNEAKFQHGDGSMLNPGISGRLRVGSMVRGVLPRPTTPLVGQNKFQYGNGSASKLEEDGVLRSIQTTLRRGTQRPTTELMGHTTYNYGRAPPNTIGEPTAVRARSKYTIATSCMPNTNRPIADALAVEDFPRGGLFTRVSGEDVVYA